VVGVVSSTYHLPITTTQKKKTQVLPWIFSSHHSQFLQSEEGDVSSLYRGVILVVPRI
jgi:hypothetical protein